MHFFYLDESGDTGRDLNPPDQPVMVLGGVSLRDKGWNETQEKFSRIISRYFGGGIPSDFELHAYELLSPKGRGHFAGVPIERRASLAIEILNLLDERKHGVHFIAIDKAKVENTPCGLSLDFSPSCPYLLGFDYLITYINRDVKRLGQSARAMIILDKKRQFHRDIERITYSRRFQGTPAHKIKRICEFSYPVDSKKNSMIQLSDLVVFCIKRFIEIEHGYRDNWSIESKKFHAKCYSIIHDRIERKKLVQREGRGLERLNDYLNAVCLFPKRQWKRKYGVEVEASGSQRP